MAIRIGVSPIAWINDDMPALGADTPLSTVLGDARAIGFSGVELGGRCPRASDELKALLGGYDLALIGGWYSGSLLNWTAEDEIAALQPHLALLEALGSGVFIFAETSNAIHGQQAAPINATPRLDAAAWGRFGERLTAVADYVHGRGLKFAYHHHLGTVVETGHDLQQFIAATGESVGLTLDTGHAALGGVNAVEVIQAHPGRIAHDHCKDVRGATFQAIKRADRSFLDGVLAGMFTAPGDGDLDFAPVMAALAAIGYEGWVVEEAEQDPGVADPRRYSQLGHDTLVQAATAAGLIVER